jgi:hypothetical protein
MILLPLNNKDEILKLLEKDELHKTLCNHKTIDPGLVDLLVQKWFALVNKDKQEIMGLFLLTPGIGKTLFFHFGLYPEYRHRDSLKYVRFCFEEVASTIDCIFMTTIAEHNLAAIKGAEKLGLIYKTTVVGGYQDDNMLIYSEV